MIKIRMPGRYRIKVATIDSISSITVTKQFTEDMDKMIIELHTYLKDDNGRLIPKEYTPEGIIKEFKRTGHLNKKYAVYEYDYYKIKNVDGKSILNEKSNPHIQNHFDRGMNVPINYIVLELITVDKYHGYGRAILQSSKTTNAGGVYDIVYVSDKSLDCDAVNSLYKLMEECDNDTYKESLLRFKKQCTKDDK